MLPVPERPLVHVSAAVFDGERMLLVQETKRDVRGRWNLPGGHVETGESIPLAAAREVLEETGLTVTMGWLVGIYTGPVSVRFVLGTEAKHVGVRAGDDIMACRAVTVREFAQMPDSELSSLLMLRAIGADLLAGKRHPLDAFVHVKR